MKKAISPIIASFFVISSILILAGRTTPQDSSLSKDESIEKRISQLEEKVKTLESEVARLREAEKYFAVPGLPPGMKSLPHGWKKYDYNGQTIYLVPLESVLGSEKKK
jgi:hypothetical protein